MSIEATFENPDKIHGKVGNIASRPPPEAKGSVPQKQRGLVASLCVAAATYAPRASSPREDAMNASHDMTTTCRAPFAARMRSRRNSQGVSPAKHSGNWGRGACSYRMAARKSGAGGGRLRTGSGRGPGRRLDGTSMRHPCRRAGTLSRTASSGALMQGRLAAPRRESWANRGFRPPD
jgi:hypothetical protein